MASNKPLCIGMALSMSWLSRNGWRRSDSDIEDVFSIQAYIDLAQKAESAGLDFLFKPDTLFLSREATKKEPGFSSLDPFVLLSAIAVHTQNIGLIATASTTFNPPYVVARQIQSLQWLSDGRAGWNIVTAIDGHKNFGFDSMMPSQQRYQTADEFMSVVQALWSSYPYQALKMDKSSGQFANIDDIHPILHHGHHFHVEGPLNVPAHPKGRAAFFQAGASEEGRAFAAKFADAVFAATPDAQSGIELKQDLASRARRLNRDPTDLKVLPGLSLFLAKDRKTAQKLFSDTHKDITRQQRCDYIKKTVGLDVSAFDDTRAITSSMLPNDVHPAPSNTHSQLLRTYIERESPNLATLLERPEVIGSCHWVIVGTPDDACDAIIQRALAGAADGIIAVPGGSKTSFDLFLNEVLPKLQAKGWFDPSYCGSNLRAYLAR